MRLTRLVIPGAWPLLVLAACGPSEGPSPTVARNEVVARTFMSVWESGETDQLVDLFYPDAVYDDFPNETQYRGIDEIAGYVSHVHDWATDVSVDVTAVHSSETGAVAEWVFSGVQDEPIGTRVPVATGKEVVLNGVTILEIDRGRIRRAADYIDQLPMVLQLGGEVRLPGGGVIRQEDAPPLPDSVGGA